MKSLLKTIQEKLVINKHSKIKSSQIKIDIDKDALDRSSLTQEDINKIIEFGDSLVIKPYVLSNKYLNRSGEIVHSVFWIRLYFDDDYLKVNGYDKCLKTDKSKLIFVELCKDNIGYSCQVYRGSLGCTRPSNEKVDTLDEAIEEIKKDIKAVCPKYL